MNNFDVLFAGGGLASGLAALRLSQKQPDLKVGIVDAGSSIGGDHIWSSFDGDMTPEQRAWTSELYACRWPGYEVRFPAYQRRLPHGYASARSVILDRLVRTSIPEENLLLERQISDVTPTSIALAGGETIEARAVIDGRGYVPTKTLTLAWQKFVGLEIETAAPHGVSEPLIMDATVEQDGGYRFIYVLPWDETRLLIEDTYYTDGPELDDDQIAARIDAYITAAGWGAYHITRRERGILPLALDGDIDKLWDEDGARVPRIGLRAGLFHPLTGYSFSDAVRSADIIAAMPRIGPRFLYSALRSDATYRWEKRRYYRMLCRMMFYAAKPEERYRILEHFYKGTEDMIARFYAGTSSRSDKLRILSGRPPVPIGSAIRAIFKKAS